VPYCISDKKDKQNFYLTADRYASSLIKPKRFKENYFIYNKQFQFDFDLCNKIDEVISINVVALDEIFNASNESLISPPDYLSLDVEGAEFKILKGAKDILKNKVLSIKCEFHTFEEANALIEFCTKYGFYVSNSRLFNSNFTTDNQFKIGLKGAHKGSRTSGDITFLKESSIILKEHINPIIDLIKVCFLAFTDNQLDKMYEYIKVLKQSDISKDILNKYSSKILYVKFINDFINSMETYPNIKAIKFSTRYPNSNSRRLRFSGTGLSLNTKDKAQIRDKYFKEIDPITFKNSIPALLNNDYIGVEILCKSYCFNETADAFKNDRLDSIIKLLDYLGLLVEDKEGKLVLDQAELDKFA